MIFLDKRFVRRPDMASADRVRLAQSVERGEALEMHLLCAGVTEDEMNAAMIRLGASTPNGDGTATGHMEKIPDALATLLMEKRASGPLLGDRLRAAGISFESLTNAMRAAGYAWDKDGVEQFDIRRLREVGERLIAEKRSAS